MSASAARQLLFVFGVAVCLLAVASALPAADPRLEPPSSSPDGEPIAGEWESIEDAPDGSLDPETEREQDRDSDSDSNSNSNSNTDDDTATAASAGGSDPEIEIRGALEPGNEVTIELEDVHTFDERTVEVNGDTVGRTEWGRLDVTVPYAEEMTVADADAGHSRTVDVATNATIASDDGAAPTTEYDLSTTVGSTPVADATVFVDGEPAGTTDEDGEAAVTLPERAGPTEIRVERGPVAGERTVDVAEPRVEFVSPLLFPGSPAPVAVSADGVGIPDATVSLEDGGTATTGDDGRTRVWLPIADEATVTATAGAETATTTVGNLYLRLAAAVVFGPGFAIGAAVTYFRLVATREDRRGGGVGDLLVALADALAGLADAFAGAAGAASNRALGLAALPALLRRVRAPPIPRLEFSVPRLRFDWRLPSLRWSSPSITRGFSTLSAIGSLADTSDRSRTDSDDSVLDRWLRSDDDDDETDDDSDGPDPPTLADEPLAPRAPSVEIRAAWHAFLDRLEVVDRETLTPGQAARRALAAGYPAERVSRLVSIVRDVEYGSREPSPERVLAARDAATALIDFDRERDDEEGSQ